jgi:DDE family transposase
LPKNRRVCEGTLSSKTGSYSQARKRLKVGIAEWLATQVYDSLVAATLPTLGDRRAFILDGSTITLAPTPALKAAFPPASNQYGLSVWPVAQLLVTHELESGCAILPEIGPMYGEQAVSELDLTKKILPRLPAHSVLLGDRNFGVFAVLYAAVNEGHDVVLRMTKPRFKALTRQATPLVSNGLHLGWELNWTPSPHDRRSHPELPASASVHVWLHEIVLSETLTLWLVTTLDRNAAVLKDVYRQRLNVETDIRDIKVSLRIEEIRAKSVEMLRKEIATSMVAYNLVIQIRRLAAKAVGVPSRRLSFTGTWTAVRIVLLAPQEWSAKEWQRQFALALRISGERKLPNRPGRSYPRKALPHRNKSTSGTKKAKLPEV